MSDAARVRGDVMLTRFCERVAEGEHGKAHRANGDRETMAYGTLFEAVSCAKRATIARFAQDIAYAFACDDIDKIGLHDNSPAKNS